MRIKSNSIVNFFALILTITVIGILVFLLSFAGPDQLSVKGRLAQSVNNSSQINKDSLNQATLNTQKKELPFSVGEKIVFNVHYKGLKIGKATLTFHGEKEFKGKKAYFITFYTNTPYFKDLEEIFAEKETYLPLQVYRQITRLGNFAMTIKEDYDQENYSIKIMRKNWFSSKDFTIDKSSVIHNAILLSYYYRLKPEFKKEDKFLVNLPTKKFDLLFRGKKNITTPLGDSEAYLFEANSANFRFWLEDNEKRIPLRIESPGMFGYCLTIADINQSEVFIKE